MTRKSLENTIQRLSENTAYLNRSFHSNKDFSMPSVNALKEIVDILKSIIFPGFFGNTGITQNNVSFYIGVSLDRLSELLSQEVRNVLGYVSEINDGQDFLVLAQDKVNEFLEKIPDIRNLLLKDVEAAYLGDPASKNIGEIIFCYPGIKALTNYRIAHELLKLEIPLIPRIISEMAHSETGIDIHPGAQIGSYFGIDHGTGIVIGETCIIGNHVKIYQGVTLGAKSFPLDADGNPIKGMPRHPIVEDNVVIYSGATILGRVTIGRDSMIGGNVWITHNLEPNSKVIQRKANEHLFSQGAGI